MTDEPPLGGLGATYDVYPIGSLKSGLVLLVLTGIVSLSVTAEALRANFD